MKSYDITFIGHMCYDEIKPYEGETIVAPGSAVLCGALAAARIGKRVAVITKMSKDDEKILLPMKESGIDVFVSPSKETTYMKVVHDSPDVDERRIFQLKNAGYITIDEIPEIDTKMVHFAGITDREFEFGLIEGIKKKNYEVSLDMQSFVRQVDSSSNEIKFEDVSNKRNLVSMLDRVKLDVLEAKILTGREDLEDAAKEIEGWGCPEIVITQSRGVLARVNKSTYYEKFTNRSVIGRTGRGDTTFAAYMSARMDNEPAEALKFAAALVSIKMETPGPFKGNLKDVLERINAEYKEN